MPADARRLTELTEGAQVLYNCANPKYTEWEQKWFPMNDAMIAAAKAADAVYAITGNLYGYGPQPGGYMREDTPLAAVGRKGKVRIKMWRDALASGVRTVEARGSDYVGAGAVGIFSFALLPAIAKGRAAWVPATRTPRTASLTPATWPAPWSPWPATSARGARPGTSPPPTPISIREVADRYCDMIGAPRLTMHKIPRWANHASGRLQRHAPRNGRDGLPVLLPVPPRQHADRADLRPHRHPLEVGLRETAEDADRIAARKM